MTECLECHTPQTLHVVSSQIRERLLPDGHCQVACVAHYECTHCGSRWREERQVMQINPLIPMLSRRER